METTHVVCVSVCQFANIQKSIVNNIVSFPKNRYYCAKRQKRRKEIQKVKEARKTEWRVIAESMPKIDLSKPKETQKTKLGELGETTDTRYSQQIEGEGETIANIEPSAPYFETYQ